MQKIIFKGNQEFMGKNIPIVYGGFGEKQKCISDKTVAELHNINTFKVRERITNNINRFKENVDFIDLKIVIRQKDNNSLYQLGYTNMEIGKSNHIYILSKRGYAKLIKIFDTDLAWEVYENLLDKYFYFEEKENYTLKPTDDKAKLTEAKLINAKVRLSNQFLKLSKVDTLSKEYKNILVSKATEILTGEQLIALPESKQKTYSATELGEMFGISSNKIGRLTNKYNLKTAEYGEYYRDKSQHSPKEVDAFRYYDSVIPELEKILEVKSKKIS